MEVALLGILVFIPLSPVFWVLLQKALGSKKSVRELLRELL